MNTTLPTPDVMQVCRNGHVVTDLLHSFPERGRGYCERCGAATIDRCATCGRSLPGAVFVPGLVPLAAGAAPSYCPSCGAAFPWAVDSLRAETPDALAILEAFLRRLPRVVRGLRSRHADRPAFNVVDEFDLEDLLRALLPLHFDEVRLVRRTPLYSAATRTDFLLPKEEILLTVKRAAPGQGERELTEQIQADVAHYAAHQERTTLVAFVHDPERLLRDPELLEHARTRVADVPTLRCIIAS
jgi:hypothetical protein